MIVINPLYDWIVIETEKPEKETPGGLIIPEKAIKSTYRGKVVGIGHKIKEIKIGDNILHNKFCGIDFERDGISYKFMREEDVMVKIPSISQS